MTDRDISIHGGKQHMETYLMQNHHRTNSTQKAVAEPREQKKKISVQMYVQPTEINKFSDAILPTLKDLKSMIQNTDITPPC